jgi:hypothetical protein
MTPILIDIDPFAPHSEACSFWHGGGCDCHPDALAAREVAHCHECDYVNAPSGARCNCRGRCICDREPDCPCVERGILTAVEALGC